MNLKEKIKYYRKQAGLSQEKMAEEIGVSRQAITKWENGTGIPDIDNLVSIAKLFQISIDDLLSNESTTGYKQSEYLYESKTEYDIDNKKNYDIKLGGVNTVELKGYEGEKIQISLLSNIIRELPSKYKVKIDDIKNRVDVEINRLKEETEMDARNGLVVSILIPNKYVGKIEVGLNAKRIDICDIDNEKIEVNGKVAEINLHKNKSEIEIDSNLDMQVFVYSHEGDIEINQISSVSRLILPDNYSFRAISKGISTKLYYEYLGNKVEDFSNPDADNCIEINGIKSELIIEKGVM